MTIQEFAKMLDGRQYNNEITVAEIEKAKELGYIVVCGYSDDGCEIYGAFREEYDCFNGGVIKDERFPGRDVLKYADIAEVTGRSVRFVQKHFKKHYNTELAGVSKTVVARILS